MAARVEDTLSMGAMALKVSRSVTCQADRPEYLKHHLPLAERVFHCCCLHTRAGSFAVSDFAHDHSLTCTLNASEITTCFQLMQKPSCKMSGSAELHVGA